MHSKVLRAFAIVLAVMAIACTIALLISDTKLRMPVWTWPSAISAAPLLLIGTSLLIFQVIRRPGWVELLKNIFLAAAFLLWGVVQLMPRSALSQILGHVVIALYVLDLAWVILSSMNGAAVGSRAANLDSPPDPHRRAPASEHDLKRIS
jgi:hypothetical protein